jgi:hypothetical protein
MMIWYWYSTLADTGRRVPEGRGPSGNGALGKAAAITNLQSAISFNSLSLSFNYLTRHPLLFN